MAKTLKDCLLEGGVKGKTFRYDGKGRTDRPYNYTVKEIDDGVVFLIVDSSDLTQQRVTLRGMGGYSLVLSNHCKDYLVEEPKLMGGVN